jgi:hypothetical protein
MELGSGLFLIEIRGRRSRSSGTVNDSPAIQVVRRHFDPHRVPQQNANVITTHSTGQIGDNLMPVIEPDAELCSGQGFNDSTVYNNLLFFFSHKTSLTWLLIEGLPERTSNSLLFIHASLFALGNEPAFTPHIGEHTTLYHLLAKAFEQGILRFIWSQSYTCHCYSPPFQVTTIAHMRTKKHYTPFWAGIIGYALPQIKSHY